MIALSLLLCRSSSVLLLQVCVMLSDLHKVVQFIFVLSFLLQSEGKNNYDILMNQLYSSGMGRAAKEGTEHNHLMEKYDDSS